MKHRASVRFWQHYRVLPEEIQTLADSNFNLMKSDLRHPSLQLKRIGRYWSVRIGLHYRALAVQDGQDFTWFWIGPHAVYDRLIRQQ